MYWIKVLDKWYLIKVLITVFDKVYLIEVYLPLLTTIVVLVAIYYVGNLFQLTESLTDFL